jgi:hypothetical protein
VREKPCWQAENKRLKAQANRLEVHGVVIFCANSVIRFKNALIELIFLLK